MLTSIRSMPRDPAPAFPWPPAGHRNFSTTFASRKNHRSLRCGPRLQADDCVRLERAPQVEQYRVELHVLTGIAGTAEHRYAPLFLIAHVDGGGGDYEVQADVVQMPTQWMKPLAACDRLCREHGWEFHRVTATSVHGPTLVTLPKLYLRMEIVMSIRVDP
ncbi:hypothetical protein [Pseudomonas sp. Pseusp16]|uniref:hypothetical protein n=1 Tax=Pseudomonas sp. Pseusp16 TaxID=3243021 RepID=UPI0039B3CD2B